MVALVSTIRPLTEGVIQRQARAVKCAVDKSRDSPRHLESRDLDTNAARRFADGMGSATACFRPNSVCGKLQHLHRAGLWGSVHQGVFPAAEWAGDRHHASAGA